MGDLGVLRIFTRSNRSWQATTREVRERIIAVSENLGLSPQGKLSGYRPLSYHDSYLCPVCRHGQLSAMTLMDAFACNFCRHIFVANLTEQSLRVEDSSQPTVWRWSGYGWQSAYPIQPEIRLILWLISGLLMVLPAAIVWLSFYTFPPLEDSPLAWLPFAWFCLTLGLHGGMIVWLLLEQYQVPFYVAWRVRLQGLLRQR
jgi:hypothetical protein